MSLRLDLDNAVRGLFLADWAIVASTMLFMEFWIIEDRIWRLCSRREVTERLIMDMRWWVERSGLVDVACPVTHEKLKRAFIQMRMKDFTHIPQLRSKGLLISCQRFCESFSQ